MRHYAHFDMKGGLQTLAAVYTDVCCADKADLAPHTANDRFRQSTHAAKNTMG
jgi:hypothetical protein